MARTAISRRIGAILICLALLEGTVLGAGAIPRPATEKDLSADKPAYASLLKPRSVTRMLEDHDIVTNSQWTNSGDFTFLDAGLVRAPLREVRARFLDYGLYPKMSSALKKFEYDSTRDAVEVLGEAGGLRMHSWVRIDGRLWDELRCTIIEGDMRGFKVHVYLWDQGGKTVVVAKGLLPGGRRMFSAPIAALFKPVSEIVLAVATRNFRSYIEEDYRKRNSQ